MEGIRTGFVTRSYATSAARPAPALARTAPLPQADLNPGTRHPSISNTLPAAAKSQLMCSALVAALGACWQCIEMDSNREPSDVECKFHINSINVRLGPPNVRRFAPGFSSLWKQRATVIC